MMLCEDREALSRMAPAHRRCGISHGWCRRTASSTPGVRPHLPSSFRVDERCFEDREAKLFSERLCRGPVVQSS